MMMGLGKRSENLYPAGNLGLSEGIKRSEFLEDTGNKGNYFRLISKNLRNDDGIW